MVLKSTDLPELCPAPGSALTLCVISHFSWCQDGNVVLFFSAEMQRRFKHPQCPVGDRSTEGPSMGRSEGDFCNAQSMRSLWGTLHGDGHHSDGNHSAFTWRLPLSSSSLLTSLRADWDSRDPSPGRQHCAGCCEGLSEARVLCLITAILFLEQIVVWIL